MAAQESVAFHPGRLPVLHSKFLSANFRCLWEDMFRKRGRPCFFVSETICLMDSTEVMNL